LGCLHHGAIARRKGGHPTSQGKQKLKKFNNLQSGLGRPFQGSGDPYDGCPKALNFALSEAVTCQFEFGCWVVERGEFVAHGLSDFEALCKV
jgi:hypothetical protein